jgi:hypothetical protein
MQEGLDPRKTMHGDTSGFYVHGLGLKNISDEKYKIMTTMTIMTDFNDCLYARKMNTDNGHKSNKSHNLDDFDIITPSESHNERFADKLLEFLSIEKSYQQVVDFCIFAGMTPVIADKHVKDLKDQGVIYEWRSGFLMTLK